MISVIVTTYNTPDFLKRCVESIYNQTYKNYEILIGIDGCQKTLDHVLNNKEFYNKCSVFYFEKNNGTYITKNNLLKEATGDFIQFFDSDDIMLSNMLEVMYNSINNNDVVSCKCINKPSNKVFSMESQIFIRKNCMDKLVCFENWICAADTEFWLRIKNKKLRVNQIKNILFERYIHQNNLTVDKKTNFQSQVRKNIWNIIKEKSRTKNFTNPTITNVQYEKLKFI